MATKRKPTPAQLAARAKFAAAAKAGKFKRAARKVAKAKPVARKTKRRRNPVADDAAFYGQLVASGAWVKGNKGGQWQMSKQFADAMPMDASRVAAFKSYCDANHMRCRILSVDTIDFAESTPGKLHENPRSRKVTHVELRSKPGAVPLWHLEARETSGAFKSFKLPAGVSRSSDFQAWARGMNYVVSATRSQLLSKLRRFT